jgi:hypothetical protein
LAAGELVLRIVHLLIAKDLPMNRSGLLLVLALAAGGAAAGALEMSQAERKAERVKLLMNSHCRTAGDRASRSTFP